MEIGKYISNLRNEKELSQRKLAELSGISNTEISRIESGERKKVSPEILKALAPYLGVSYENLMEVAGYISKTSNRFAKELSDNLIKLKITLDEIAPNIGLPKEVLQKILRAEKGPTVEDYIKLGKWLGYSEQQAKELYYENINLVSEQSISTLAAHRLDGYDKPLTEDEKAAVEAFLKTYRQMKQNKEG